MQAVFIVTNSFGRLNKLENLKLEDPSQACNCDKNDPVWREDSGLLTDRSALPVKEVRFGDTGVYSDGTDEKGFYTLGKLRCYGIAHG